MSASKVLKGVAVASFSAKWVIGAISATSKDPAQRAVGQQTMAEAAKEIELALKS